MGYVRQKKIYRLRFEDPEMDGLIVRATAAPLGEFLALAELAGKVDGKAPDPAAVRGLFARFATVLVGWNLEEEDGTPIPATLDGLLGQDTGFVMEIFTAWSEAVANVDAPLGVHSSAGGTSPAPSIPMEPLSTSRAS